MISPSRQTRYKQKREHENQKERMEESVEKLANRSSFHIREKIVLISNK
jgi:hypothetical protein